MRSRPAAGWRGCLPAWLADPPVLSATWNEQRIVGLKPFSKQFTFSKQLLELLKLANKSLCSLLCRVRFAGPRCPLGFERRISCFAHFY